MCLDSKSNWLTKIIYILPGDNMWQHALFQDDDKFIRNCDKGKAACPGCVVTDMTKIK